jgi:mono/diheme cytochrome c family protein
MRKEHVMRAVLLALGILCFSVVEFSFAAAPGGQIARGDYVVNGVAMCAQCHTPRDASGDLDRTRPLRGAPIPLRSPFAGQPWAVAAPAIAGLPGWSAEDATALLTTGRRLSGQAPRGPMPPFRMTREDGEAVILYLRSVR